MKFLLLMYAEEGVWPPEEHALAVQESVAVCQELHDKGQYLSAAPLQPPSTAACVRVREGKTVVTDGPFAETKEQLGGYFLIEAADIAEAIGIAARLPGPRRGVAEVRPVMEVPNLPVSIPHADQQQA
ncbi:MAG: hypothetical protein CMJ46_09360 [Planctomyces sp.]|nr:hypothetical protein [Planctomyces sp.]